MAETERAMTPREFLETCGLYRWFPFEPHWTTPQRISRECPHCKKETTWAVRSTSYPEKSSPYYLEYECVDCQKVWVVFLLRVAPAQNKSQVAKIGQFPEPSIQTSRKLQERLGGDIDFYRKGLICRNQGYGIAALAYFRRVVEDKTGELIDTVADLAAAHGISVDDVQKLRAAKNEKSYDKRLEVAATLVPTALLAGGMNPLGTLHDLLSQGIHGLSEDECLQISEDIRDVFEHIFTTLRTQVEDQQSFIEKAKKLAGKRTAKPPR
jgi:hypothetical protein